MKKSLLLIPLLFIGSFALATEDFPSFPMTIHGNIKIGSTDLAGGTLKVYNSSNKEIATYEITQSGKYGSDNVSILPLLLNKFTGSLSFKVSYNGKAYVVDSIDDSNRGTGCPSKSSITFVSENCRYDIILKAQSSSNGGGGSSSGGSGGGGGGGGSSSSKTNTTTNTSKTTTGDSTKADTNTNETMETNTEANTNTGTKLGTKVVDRNNNLNNQLIGTKKTWYQEGNQDEKLSNGYSREYNNAYVFSYLNGITTAPTIEKANMNGNLTRIAMAKMLSNYAINVLGKKPDTTRGNPKFNDVTTKQNSDYGNGVTLAYQLGIMGIDIKDNNFRPNDSVTRAEFATALSRMLYGISDGKGNTKYYEPHITKLYNEGIISNTNPRLKEKRGYIMLMLMRSMK